MTEDIYTTIGEVFDPSKYYNCIEAGTLDRVVLRRPCRKYTRSTGADGHRNRQATPEAVRGQYNE